MKLNLKRPLICFDLETTGVDTSKDRIIQIGLKKIMPNGDAEFKNRYINPTIPIPEGATEVHGIDNDMIAEEPTFKNVSISLFEYFKGCDVLGYNSNAFDVPLLMNEFARCGIAWPESDTRLLDVMAIERVVNSHKLSDTYERYIGEEFNDAHNAEADVYATMEVLEKQLDMHESIPCDVDDLDKFCQGDRIRVDIAGFLKQDTPDGPILFSAGKHKNTPVSEAPKSYINWVLGDSFSEDTKNRILEARK